MTDKIHNYTLEGTQISSNREMTAEVLQTLLTEVKKKRPDEDVNVIDIQWGDEAAEMMVDYASKQPLRLRRITGYLVGTLDKFNDYKRAEEKDRVKHI